MSTTETTTTTTTAQPDRPTAFDRPTAAFPTGQWLARLEYEEAAHHERLSDLWEDVTPTELLPVVGTAAGTTFPCVSTLPEPTAGLEARRTAPTGTKGLRRQGRLRRHLRAALTAIALAAAILIPMQLFAAAGISAARQAALASSSSSSSSTGQAATLPRTEGGDQPSMSGQTAPMSDRTSAAQPDVRSDIPADWVTEYTGAAYDRTNPAASPLDLPRCTTSPDTPLPCLATISPDSRRAVVLEEDASLTALAHQ